MTIRSFKHISASSLKEAASILKKANGKGAVIAGGTDLLGVLKDKIHPDTPEVLIDLKTIPKLNYINGNKKGLRIGALATLDEIRRNETIREQYPLLAEAARAVASPQIRNMGTIAGNICQEPRCWYYRLPDNLFYCIRKGGSICGALLGENRYHSIFGSVKVAQPSCAQTCPGNIEIPAYMSLIRQGDIDGAAEIILADNPIPAITGRVCPHFCEAGCNRSDFDEAVSIRNVERIVGDHVLDNAAKFMAMPKKDLKKSVAIVGAGPAGLSAAFYLRKEGYQVTVIDKMPQAGGMLTYGIPSYRLPKDVVQRLVKIFKAMGIGFKLKTTVGKKGHTLSDLRKKFDFVFLATGAWGQRTLNIENSDLLTSGLDFLVSIGSGDTPDVGKKVIVIGGGNVAVDVAISARRLGAEDVTMVCLESRDTMPAFEEEIAEALHEGVTILPSFGPQRVIEKKGRLSGMDFISCTSVFDETGCFNPSFDTAQTKTLEADQIILAIGQSTDLSFAGKDLDTERGLIVIDEKTRKTSLSGIYAGGDVVSGPASIIHSIAAGRKTAFAIAKKKTKSHSVMGQPLEMHPECHMRSERTPDISDTSGIQSEAMRCVNCGCVAVNASDVAPALIALDATIKTTKRSIKAGEFFDATLMKSTVLAEDELVEEIEIPAPTKQNRQGYHKFRIRNSIDFPIVSLAYSFDLMGQVIQNPKIVLGAVAPTPLRIPAIEEFLDGKTVNEETAAAVGEVVGSEVRTLAKNAFKVQIVKGLLRRMTLENIASS
jgi:NADPH-dependent glutamate synthase beta subunit-like oxidoreductase/CO/xanthine dehydrogenase FAD-binding subunit